MPAMNDELVTDLERVEMLAAEQKEENLRFRTYLKAHLTWPDERLDAYVAQVSAAVADQIDCLQCAACCRTMICPVEEQDIERLARTLGLTTDACEARYLVAGTDAQKRLAGPPCPLLDGTRCRVYTGRPSVCLRFPYLDVSNFRSRLLSVIDDAALCPIVFNTLQRLKRRFGFGKRRRE